MRKETFFQVGEVNNLNGDEERGEKSGSGKNVDIQKLATKIAFPNIVEQACSFKTDFV